MPKYKIAFLLPNFENQGGINVVVNTLSSYLMRVGHDIHLFPIGKTEYSDTENIHTINSNKKKEQIILFQNKFNLINQNKNFDLIISNTLRANYIIYKLNIKNSLMVFHAPGLLKEKRFYTILRRKINFRKWYKNQNLIALSNCFKENFTKKYPNIKYHSFDVIYNGFDLNKIQQLANEEFQKPDFPYIVCVGRLTKTKDYRSAILAFSEVHKLYPDLHLIFLGNGVERENLEALTKQLELKKVIHFMGRVDNVFSWIKNAELLLHTSHSETFGNILVEALSVNTPVVATNVECGPSEILTDELKEFLVPLHDDQLLIDKILLALRQYPIINEKYIHKFCIEKIASQYINFIENQG